LKYLVDRSFTLAILQDLCVVRWAATDSLAFLFLRDACLLDVVLFDEAIYSLTSGPFFGGLEVQRLAVFLVIKVLQKW